MTGGRRNSDERIRRELEYQQAKEISDQHRARRSQWFPFEAGLYSALSARVDFTGKIPHEFYEECCKDERTSTSAGLEEFVAALEKIPRLTDNLAIKLRDMLGFIHINYPPSFTEGARIGAAKKELNELEKELASLNHPIKEWLESPEAGSNEIVGQRFEAFRLWLVDNGFPKETENLRVWATFPKPAPGATDIQMGAWLIERARTTLQLAEWHSVGVSLELYREALQVHALPNQTWEWYASHIRAVMSKSQLPEVISPFNNGLGRQYFWETEELAAQNRSTTRALYDIAVRIAKHPSPAKSLEAVVRLESIGKSPAQIAAVLEDINRCGNDGAVAALATCTPCYLEGAVSDLQHVQGYAPALSALQKYGVPEDKGLDFMYRLGDWEIGATNIINVIIKIAESETGHRGAAIKCLVEKGEQLCSDKESETLLDLIEKKHVGLVRSYFGFAGSQKKQKLLLTEAKNTGYDSRQIAALVERLNGMSDDDAMLVLAEDASGMGMGEDYRTGSKLHARYASLVTAISQKSAKALLEHRLVDALVRSSLIETISMDKLNMYIEAAYDTGKLDKLRKRRILHHELEMLAADPDATIRKIKENIETRRTSVPERPYRVICVSQHMSQVHANQLARLTGCTINVQPPNRAQFTSFDGQTVVVYDTRYGSHSDFYAAQNKAHKDGCIRFITARSTHPEVLSEAVDKALRQYESKR